MLATALWFLFYPIILKVSESLCLAPISLRYKNVAVAMVSSSLVLLVKKVNLLSHSYVDCAMVSFSLVLLVMLC